MYPDNRFVRYYETESVNKARDAQFLSTILESEFQVDPALNFVSILDARDGSDLDFETAMTRRIAFCGAANEDLKNTQDSLLEYGLYPDRMELSSVSTLGGLCDYARFNSIDAPVLFFELTSQAATIFIQSKGQLDVARPIPVGLDSIYPILQRELGLKDESSARKLFFSNTFDFAEMGPKLMRKVIKELQASTGFYEVQTGQTIEYLFISILPKNLSWVAKTISEALGLEIMQPSYEPWMKSLNVKVSEGVELMNLGSRWMGLFSLMGEYHLREEVANG
ncbi:MAG: hypothetical protein AAGC73_09630 [Verrucomicrobiota bacterium]